MKQGLNTYRVAVNYCGEVHSIYTTAVSDAQARNNAIHQLARCIGVKPQLVQVRTKAGNKVVVHRITDSVH
jgi:hypothetical protein